MKRRWWRHQVAKAGILVVLSPLLPLYFITTFGEWVERTVQNANWSSALVNASIAIERWSWK